MADDLVNRLRGIYRIPIRDGLGPAGGEEPNNPNEFVRTFPSTPIQQEAADRIEALEAALKPFAEFAEHVAQDHPGWDHDRFVMAIGICEHDDLRWSWFRAARSALTGKGA